MAVVYICKLSVQLISQLPVLINKTATCSPPHSRNLVNPSPSGSSGQHCWCFLSWMPRWSYMHCAIEEDHYRLCTHEMKFSCKFNETIFENLEDHEKRLSFIFHLFVKSLINISDVCVWPLYWNFVESASSDSSHTTPPRVSPNTGTPHSWTGTDVQNSSGAGGIHRVWTENGAIWCKLVAQFDCGYVAVVTSGVVWSQTHITQYIY